ncbi:hypothetical protein [Saccharopolyspora sp. CA-218241]|uniref:hypothetical protein n=1 Tax=Saccharopolyspora sp. CA-218241 TaxID=3240027 RepID=UPI003D985960
MPSSLVHVPRAHQPGRQRTSALTRSGRVGRGWDPFIPTRAEERSPVAEQRARPGEVAW